MAQNSAGKFELGLKASNFNLDNGVKISIDAVDSELVSPFHPPNILSRLHPSHILIPITGPRQAKRLQKSLGDQLRQRPALYPQERPPDSQTRQLQRKDRGGQSGQGRRRRQADRGRRRQRWSLRRPEENHRRRRVHAKSV